MAAPSPAIFHSALPSSPAASASPPSNPPASAPSPSPVQAEDTKSPAVSPNSDSLSIPPQPPPPPLQAPPPSVTPAAPLPPPPTSSLNSLKTAPRPVLSPQYPPSRPPSLPPTGDAPPPLLLSPTPPPSVTPAAPLPSPPTSSLNSLKIAPRPVLSPHSPPSAPPPGDEPPPLLLLPTQPPAAVKAPKSSPQFNAKPPSSSSSSSNAGDAPTEIHNLSHPSPTDIAGTRSKPSSRFNAGGVTGIGIGVGLFILLSFIFLLVWCKCRRRRKIGFGNTNIRVSLQPDPLTSDASVMKIHSSAPLIGTISSRTNSLYSHPISPDEYPRFPGPQFTFDELGNATNWFSSENLLGKDALQENSGSCVTSHIYKGYLPNGREIAVKHHPVQAGATRGSEHEFRAELEIISRVHHRHLVSLVGYCITDDSKFLVYDHIPNHSLYFHLHGEGAVVLDWEKRVRIAVGSARGIAYLHEDCCPRIIHRDIKSSNILLDNNYEPWVSDFGLAKLAFDANPHIATRVMGTFGYMAPEYAVSGELTEKSDVYSFGVVLLELITGKKPIDISVSLRDESLVEWARPLLNCALQNEEFDGLVDPMLDNNYIKSEISRMIEAAAACLHDSAAERPRMSQVVKILSNVARLDLMNGTRPGESEAFNADERSREIEAFRRMQLRSHGYSTEYFSF